MLKDSIYPEEARIAFVRAGLLAEEGEKLIESLLGKKIILRFDILKSIKRGMPAPKLFVINGRHCVGEDGNLADQVTELILESVSASCTIQDVVISAYIKNGRQDKFSSKNGKLNFINVKICISSLLIGERMVSDYLTIINNQLYLFCVPGDYEKLDDSDGSEDDVGEENDDSEDEDDSAGSYGVEKIILTVDEFGIM